MKRVCIRARHMAALAVVAGLVVAGCGGSSSSNAHGASQGTGSSHGGAKPTYTVGIDIPFHPIWDYVAANADKYFAGKPYNVKFKVLDATTQVPAFGKGDLDVMTTPPSFIPRVKQEYGFDAAEFFPLARWTIGPQLLVPKDSPYATLEQLKGQAVAIPPLTSRFGAEEAAVLAQTGQNIRTYFKLQQTDAAAQQLALGRVKAAFLEAPVTYPLLQSGKFKPIWSVHDAFLKYLHDPAVVNGGYIARTSFIKTHRPFIDALVTAAQDAWNRFNTDPKAVLATASKQSGIATAQLAVIGKTLDLDGIPKSQRCISHRDVTTWAKMFQLLAKSGFIKQAPADPATLFVITCRS